jgi:glycosyltransferase involved in cell wall biosynthesis
MAGKVDVVDVEYYEQEIKPHIDGEQIQYLGEANHFEKNALLGGACAMLFPITWREPFGLVMVESMAAGTPVIAMNLGSAPEVITHGKTGFLCTSVEECISAIDKALKLDRYTIRENVSNRFGVQQMVEGYEAVYRQLMEKRFASNGHLHRAIASNLNIK